MDDQRIIQLYWDRSEKAITATAAKYGRYCHYIAYNILRNDEDAEECVNDTWLNTWNTIPPQKPRRLQAFLGKITRNLSLNRYEKRTTEKRGGGEITLILDELSECIPAEQGSKIAEELAFTDLLNRFLDTLSPQDCKLFVRRYWYMSPIKELTRDFHISESKASVTLFRTRKKLRTYLEKEGVTL
ncbi:MAG: RNA polymerase sigma factor [Clostridia bacterium]|nr:RNA polymerase sigma factor [Clostridia bacterium]